MNQTRPIRIRQVKARLNVGGPAVIVTELMRGLDSRRFQAVLITGYCTDDEADFLEEVATDVSANPIHGFDRGTF